MPAAGCAYAIEQDEIGQAMPGDKDKSTIAWLVGLALFMVATLMGLIPNPALLPPLLSLRAPRSNRKVWSDCFAELAFDRLLLIKGMANPDLV